MTLDLATRQQIALRIRRALPQVRQVLLFGSQARGDATPDSDIDLLLIVPDGEDRIAAAVDARRSLIGMGLGFDVLVLQDAEWQQLRSSPAWFHRQITHDAVRMDDAA
ncbi:MAG: nucleotidyltransferase domain-containing protein [Deltaproteobacteria bacterium]|nr:nucleotidyltransferase domain-containing protein [Deltaproteobacteria bacterium]